MNENVLCVPVGQEKRCEDKCEIRVRTRTKAGQRQGLSTRTVKVTCGDQSVEATRGLLASNALRDPPDGPVVW